MTKEAQGKTLHNIIAKACVDNNFKQRLLKDATAVLREEGMEVPVGMEIKMVENTGELVHVVLPRGKNVHALDDAALQKVVGGFKRPKPKDDDIPLFEISK